jgi:hypothetical protein
MIEAAARAMNRERTRSVIGFLFMMGDGNSEKRRGQTFNSSILKKLKV